MALITFILQLTNTFHEGEFSLKYGYPHCIYNNCITNLVCLLSGFIVFGIKTTPPESEGYLLFNKMRPIRNLFVLKVLYFLLIGKVCYFWFVYKCNQIGRWLEYR